DRLRRHRHQGRCRLVEWRRRSHRQDRDRLLAARGPTRLRDPATAACVTRRSRPAIVPAVHGVTVGGKRGGLRALVACSNEYASSTSRGSLHAGPMNTIPTGRPWLSPIGTVMLGVPAAAATP